MALTWYGYYVRHIVQYQDHCRKSVNTTVSLWWCYHHYTVGQCTKSHHTYFILQYFVIQTFKNNPECSPSELKSERVYFS